MPSTIVPQDRDSQVEIKSPSAWELGKQLFGKYQSESGNLSVASKREIAKKIHAKKNND